MSPPKLNANQRNGIDAAVDSVFDNLLARLLGGSFRNKNLFIRIVHDQTIPGLFENAVNEEGGQVDTDMLGNIIEVAQDYLQKYRSEAKAATKRKIQAVLHDVHTGRVKPEDFRNHVEGELVDLFGKVKAGVHAVVASETQLASTMGTKTAIDQISGALGIEPIFCFVPVRDKAICEECVRIHLLPDGITPRVFKESEISHDYHVRGSDTPSFHELHPHGRCSLSSILPGFGFDASGRVAWIHPDHREWDYQHSGAVGLGVDVRRSIIEAKGSP